jgi:hypothetical protein
VGIDTPVLDLSQPGTYLFTMQQALGGKRLNRFASTLRTPDARAAYAAAEEPALRAAGLGEDEIAMVLERDWAGLIRAGAHVQVLTFIAAAIGQNLWDVAADQVGCSRDELILACPRPVSGLPNGMRRA